MGVGSSLAVSPTGRLALTTRYEAFRRLEEDGIYAAPQIPVRGAVGGDRFVGYGIGIVADYRINDLVSVTGTAGHFDTGALVEVNGPDDDITSFQLKLAASF